MYNKRDGRPSGGRSFHPRGFNNQDGPRQMFKAVCSSCGKDCEVPFMPSGNKPVFCSNCFERQPGGFNKPHLDNRSNVIPPQNNEQMNIIITKLDKIINLLSSRTNESCCQKETPLVATPQPAEADTEIVVEKKAKTKKKTSKK